MHHEDITRILERLDDNTKIVSEFTGVIKNVLAQDPHAFEGNFIEHAVRSHFGDPMYDRLSEIYKTIIGT